MNSASPKIDLRNQTGLAGQVKELLLQYCSEDWSGIDSITADPQAETIIQLFSRMMEITIQRLNRTPDKNFMAFLDMLGMSLAPPQAARTVLRFSLAKGAEYASVPERTQVASTEGSAKKPVIFETVKGLTVIAPKLVRAISAAPSDDKWRDHSPILFGEEEEGTETLLEGVDLVKHRLYLGHNELFNFEDKKKVSLVIDLGGKEEGKKNVSLAAGISGPAAPVKTLSAPAVKTIAAGMAGLEALVKSHAGPVAGQAATVIGPALFPGGFSITGKIGAPEVKWFTFADGSDEPVELTDYEESHAGVANLGQSGTITFRAVEPIPEKKISGFTEQDDEISRTSRWIFAELTVPASKFAIPRIVSIKTVVEDTAAVDSQPDAAFSNKFALDLTKDFYPFGDRPKFNDTFSLGSKELFGREGASLEIQVLLSEGVAPPDTTAITLKWEFRDGDKWRTLGLTSGTGVTAPGTHAFTDSTNAFTASGKIGFTCPPAALSKVNGEESRWVRVRIVGGDYGEEAKYKEYLEDNGAEVVLENGVKKYRASDGKLVELSSEKTVWSYIPATYAPPSLQSLTMKAVTPPAAENMRSILMYNNFHYEAWSGKGAFKPFKAPTDTTPSLSLAFDNDISELPVTLFFPLESGYLPPSLGAESNPPVLKWEYWNGKSWNPLTLDDYTEELTKKEMLNFLAPSDLAKKVCFEESHYWIRARLAEGEYTGKPKVDGIYSNTVWAENLLTVTDELLGSSNGKPDQIFQIPNFPVLPGQTILVREAALTQEEEKNTLGEEGKDAVEQVKDDAGNVLETWVRWHEVEHFQFSLAHDRHYVADRNKGEILFGNGKKGMIPPAGINNVKCGRYRHGGGTSGNIAKGTATKPRTAIPYIDAVTNPAIAEGGTDLEDLQGIKIRGPRSIKTRNRAVTFRDYEWIAEEASPKVARAKCLPTTNPLKQFRPGWVTVIIVPDSTEPKPTPSTELLAVIREYIDQRTSGNIISSFPSQVNLIPPNYVRVNVKVDAAVDSISEAKIIGNEINQRLNTFFHPLLGGPDGNGWEFGRDVYITEIYELLEKTQGVNYVTDVSLAASVQIYQVGLKHPFFSTFAFPRKSRVFFDKNRIMLSLGETVPANEEISSLHVLGFKEGDMLEISYAYEEEGEETRASAKVTVTSVAGTLGDTLEIEPLEFEEPFPVESSVETYLKPEDTRIRSYLVTPIMPGTHAKIKVAVPGTDQEDELVLSHRDWPSNAVTGQVESVEETVKTVYLEENDLPYPGEHTVSLFQTPDNETKSEQPGQGKSSRYLMDTSGGTVHDLMKIEAGCNVGEIPDKHRRYFRSLDEMAVGLKKEIYTLCASCCNREKTKR